MCEDQDQIIKLNFEHSYGTSSVCYLLAYRCWCVGPTWRRNVVPALYGQLLQEAPSATHQPSPELGLVCFSLEFTVAVEAKFDQSAFVRLIIILFIRENRSVAIIEVLSSCEVEFVLNSCIIRADVKICFGLRNLLI